MDGLRQLGKLQFSMGGVLSFTAYFAVELALYFGDWNFTPAGEAIANFLSFVLLLLLATTVAVLAIQERGVVRAFSVGCLVPFLILSQGQAIFESIDLVVFLASPYDPQDFASHQTLAHVRFASLFCGLFAYGLSGLRFKSKDTPDPSSPSTMGARQ